MVDACGSPSPARRWVIVFIAPPGQPWPEVPELPEPGPPFGQMLLPSPARIVVVAFITILLVQPWPE